MRLRFTSHLAAAAALAAAPVAASAAPIANPASSLSVAKAPRAASTTAHDSGLAGGAGIYGILIAVGVIAIVVIAAVNDDDNPKSP